MSHDLSGRTHDHVFDAGNTAGERRTWIVVAVTAATMAAEIAAGWMTGSMALLADGWHMGTHVAALAMTAIAYRLARRWAGDTRFAFGTWKVEVLGAFASALVLGIVALAILGESIHRLVRPGPIDFGPALAVAVVGLTVNLLSVLVLGGHGPGQGHRDHGHDAHGHAHHDHDRQGPDHGDLNLRSAYAHVLADALTSVLAIVALLFGMYAGWTWLDPAIGVVGAIVIAVWARGLLGESARVLLDREMDAPLVVQVRGAIESDGDAQLADLHLWRVGRDRYAAVLSIVADAPLAADEYRQRLRAFRQVAHVTIEVNRCGAGAARPCR